MQLLLLLMATSLPMALSAAPSRFILAMGDSYTTTGFNATISPQPSVDLPFGNPAYPEVTYAGGENWLDVLVYICSPAGTVVYDYAVGGNPVNLTRVGQSPDSVDGPIKDMLAQSLEWQKQTSSIGWRDYNTLSIAWFGINDINSAGLYANKSMADTTPILDADIEDLFSQLYVMYEFGVRKFLIVQVMPMARAPVWTVGDPSRHALAYNLSSYWNNAISQGTSNFASMHTDAEVATFDPWPVFDSILDNYAEYGAPNNYCNSYPDGEPCLWHDFIHGGLVIQRALGEAIFKFISQSFSFY